MNVFKYNYFYSLLKKSKKNQDVLSLITKAKGFNTKSNTLTISHGVHSTENVPQAFYNSFFKVEEQFFKGVNPIFFKSYLTNLNSKIDLEPVCIGLKKFWKHDKARSDIIKKEFVNYQIIAGYFLISFQDKKEKFLCFIDIHQIYENRHNFPDPFFVNNFKFIKTINKKFSSNELNGFIEYFEKEYFNELIAIKDNDARTNIGLMLKHELTKKFEIFNWEIKKKKTKIEKKYLIKRSELNAFFSSPRPRSFSKNRI